MSKTYTGYRFGSDPSDRVTVMIHEKGKKPRPLESYRHIRYHGDFNWGYSGSGPAQLALAMVADVTGEKPELAVYMMFKSRVVGCLPCEGWSIDEGEIRHILHDIKTYLKKRGKR